MDDSPIRYFYDLEFIDDGATIDLVSIGIVAVPAWVFDPQLGPERERELQRAHAREYYAVNADMNLDALKAHAWLVPNVLPHLPLVQGGDLEEFLTTGQVGAYNTLPDALRWVDLDRNATEVKPRWVIANEVRDFLLAPLVDAVDDHPLDIELWANYGAYDHVGLAQLWGPMNDLPPGIPMFTNDLQQYARAVGDTAYRPDRDPERQPEHHALADAWYDLDLFAGLHTIDTIARASK